METVKRIVNGVDIHRLKETIMAVKRQPETGELTFRATNEWLGGAHNQTTIKNFHVANQENKSRVHASILDNDEPEVLLGNHYGANPAENLLHALAGSLTTSIVYHAAARGYKLEKVASVLEGELSLQGCLSIDASVRNGYKRIKVTYNIEGDLTDEQKEEILKLGPAFSPVFDVITNGTTIEIKLNKS